MASVAVYDSGVGGLSIFLKVRAACPDADLTFVSDNEAYPYGTKSEQALLERVLAVAMSIVDACAPDVLVLACNTASTVCLPILRQHLDIPVVGVVPAIKPASKLSKTKTIGLLATPATVSREYTDKLIRDFAPECVVIKVGSKTLVDMAEQKLAGEGVKETQLGFILSPFINNLELDVVVLACTHFPLLADEITDVFKRSHRSISLVDSGDAIASRVKSLIHKPEVAALGSGNRTALFTKKIGVSGLRECIEKLGIDSIGVINI